MRPYSDSPSIPHWDFITDSRGRFDVPLGDFKTWEDKENRPGWGIYAFYVDPFPQDAGAVSPRLLHFAGPDVGASQLKSDDEWGPFQDLPLQGLSITLQIQAGVTLEGRIWDYTHPDQPLSGIKVSTDNDLHADSHTGWGGAIFQQQAVTDAQGRFVIKHIFPVRFDVSLDGLYSEDGGAYWLKTKINGQWDEAVGDEIAPKSDEKVVHLELMATKDAVFRYFGKVVDANGQPISGAKVTFGMSYHDLPRTWTDEHNYESAVTDSGGHYEIKLGTPWVRGMDAEAAGGKRLDRWNDEGPAFSPGEYNFTMEKN